MPDVTEKELRYKVTGDATGVLTTLQRIRAEAKQLADQQKKDAAESARLMREQVGSLNKGLSLLRGGGALGGASMALGSLKDLTAEAVKLKDAFNEGSIGAAEMADRLARAVPIAGSIYSIIRDLQELQGGELALAAKRLKAEEAINNAWMDRKKLVNSINDELNPESKRDQQRREIRGKFNTAINREMGTDVEASIARNKDTQQELRLSPEAQLLVRQRDAALAKIDELERRDKAAKVPSKSLSEIQSDMVKLAFSFNPAFKESVGRQTDQAMKAANSAIATWFGVGGKFDPAKEERERRASFGSNPIGKALAAALGIADGAFGVDPRKAAAISGTAGGGAGSFAGTGVGMLTAEQRRADQMLGETKKQTKALNDLRGTMTDIKNGLKALGVAVP